MDPWIGVSTSGGVLVKLVACPNCHAQYDVADLAANTVTCPCGTSFPAEPPRSRDAAVARCAGCGALLGRSERACSYCGAEATRDTPPAGPVCPECFARNPDRARHCTSCGVAFLPQPVRTREVPLECPVCPGVRLAARSLGGLWVDECPGCLGLWAAGEVMDRLVDRARERRRAGVQPAADATGSHRRAAWQAAVAYRRCPECGARMQRRNFGRRSGVVVDWCGMHGTWLDAHEMEDIASFVLEGGLESASGDDGNRHGRLPADPARVAAVLAAEQILAEERARSIARRSGAERGAERGPGRTITGLGDFLAELLK